MMNPRITDILTRMRTRGHLDDLTVQTKDLAELLSILAEEQADSAKKMEKQTRQLIYLSWALVLLTAVLCFIAVKFQQ